MDAAVTEFSLRIGSLYAYGIIKVGRNATAFLGNAADRRRMRTVLGSVYGIQCPGPLCLMANDIRVPWAWSRPCGPVPYMLYGIIKVGKNADGISQKYV